MKNKWILRYVSFALILLAPLLGGCNLTPKIPAPADPNSAPYRPPTLIPKTTRTFTPGPQETAREEAAECVNLLTFVRDITIPDGTVVQAGSTVDKRWEVENSGTCSWGEGYKLKLVNGPDLSAQPEQSLFPARSGTQAEIRILFTAPEPPGLYRSAWQAVTPGGEAFGDLFFIEIKVED